jgi:serine/threonine protein kinase
LAIDRDRLDTPCAIKQFLPNAKTAAGRDKAIELFAREALRLRDLGDNPQIPALLGFFEEGGYLYLVQEYIAGETIGRRDD